MLVCVHLSRYLCVCVYVCMCREREREREREKGKGGGGLKEYIMCENETFKCKYTHVRVHCTQ